MRNIGYVALSGNSIAPQDDGAGFDESLVALEDSGVL